jgi:phage terminase small subunit
MRRGSRGLPPLDLADVPSRLERDGRWLWEALGRLLVGRGYLTELDRTIFELLCGDYELLRRGQSELEQHERAGDKAMTRGARRVVASLRRHLDSICRECGATVRMIETLERDRTP